jgi:hypothetical protein
MWLFPKKFLLNYHNSRNDKPSMYRIKYYNTFAAHFGVFYMYIYIYIRKYITTQCKYNTCIAV